MRVDRPRVWAIRSSEAAPCVVAAGVESDSRLVRSEVHMYISRITLLALAAAAGSASAQSASVFLNASSNTVSPGGSITVTLSVDPDVGGAGAGVFGPSGLFGFGGEISLGGDRASDASASNASILAGLPSGNTVMTGDSGVRVGAGRGLDVALPALATDLISFDVGVDGAAAAGSFTIDYAGAIVLVESDALVTYSTSPGANQSTLGVATLTITVGQSGCNAADLAPPVGVLDLGDVDAFIPAFLSGDPSADLAGPFGVLDLADVDTFIVAFLGGCP